MHFFRNSAVILLATTMLYACGPSDEELALQAAREKLEQDLAQLRT